MSKWWRLAVLVAVLAASLVMVVLVERYNAAATAPLVPDHPTGLIINEYTLNENGTRAVLTNSVRVRDQRSIAAIASTINSMRPSPRIVYTGVTRLNPNHDLLRFLYAHRHSVLVNVHAVPPPGVLVRGHVYGTLSQWERLLSEIGLAG